MVKNKRPRIPKKYKNEKAKEKRKKAKVKRKREKKEENGRRGIRDGGDEVGVEGKYSLLEGS